MEKSKQAKTLKERAKKYIPFWVQIQIYKLIKNARFFKNFILRKKITKEDIKKILRQAGLRKGDIVVAHSSLGRIGHVENGPDDVINAFLEIIGKDGLLIMPAFSILKYNRKLKMYIFDVRNTPTYTGSIPETFRKRKGSSR